MIAPPLPVAGPRVRAVSWSGTLPPPETPPERLAETPAERTDHLYLPPLDAPPLDAPPLDAPPLDAPPLDAPPLDVALPSPLAGAGWCREPEVLLRLLEGLAAL